MEEDVASIGGGGTVTLGDGATVAVGSGTMTVAVGRSGRQVGGSAVGGSGVAVGCGGHAPGL